MTVSSNFGNRPQHTAALDISATGDHVIFAPAVKVRVHGVRVVFPKALAADATNHLDVELQSLKGSDTDTIGDGWDNDAGQAKAKGQVIVVVAEANAFYLEAGESLIVNATVAGTGAGQFSYNVDYEVIGS